MDVVHHGVLAEGEQAAEVLISRIRDALDELDWPLPSLDLVGLTVGPGSFTGLRVGVTIAKLLAYSLSIPVAAVDTMQAIAATSQRSGGEVPGRRHSYECSSPMLVRVAMDAQRNGLYWRDFRLDPTAPPMPTSNVHVDSVDQFVHQLESGRLLIGPGLAKVLHRLPPHTTVAAEELWKPWAACVALLALHAAQAHRYADIWTLVPHYVGTSAAEEPRS
jgi:tRNA threonylcarbamoyladenosine biosynthesis protein TsaB